MDFATRNFETRKKTQETAVAVMAVNAMANPYMRMRPSPAMIERAMAPTDEEFEEDSEETMALWGGIVEQAHVNYRIRGVPTTRSNR